MKFALRWIADYVDLPEIDRPEGLEEISRRLTGAGFAVEGLETSPAGPILDIDVTTNRPDCMNHYGIARELSAILARPLRPLPRHVKEAAEPASAFAKVTVEEPESCPRFSALVIRGVKIGPSPGWLVERLEALDKRAINNVVDITNYVMWECGQPLHAYDLQQLAGGELRVRLARPGEKLVTLDKAERELLPDHLVIADAERPCGLAGIMGGLDSEVTADTVDVLLEAAHFSPRAVRKAGRKIGLHTDARHRFERGADPEATLPALRRAAALIVELAGGQVQAGALDAWQPLPQWPPALEIEHAKLCRFGGVEIAPAEVERIFAALGFANEPSEGRYRLTAPSWRYYDFQNPYPQDFYEEALRVYGFEKVPYTLPAIAGVDSPELPSHRRRRRTQDHLAACGLVEAIDFAFHDRAGDDLYPNLVGDKPALPLANSLSDRYALMRRSLLPNLVASARYNQRRGQPAVRLFEVGHVFWNPESADAINAEMDAVALVMGGESGMPWERAGGLDFFDLKGVLDSLAERLGVSVAWRPGGWRHLVPGTAAEIVANGRVVGLAGQLAEDELYPLFVAELSLDLELLPAPVGASMVVPPSRFPGIPVDTTLTHALATPWQTVADAIRAAAVPDLVSFTLKDRYRGEGVPAGAVNTTIAFLYNSEASSLTQDTVNERHQALVAALAERFSWHEGMA